MAGLTAYPRYYAQMAPLNQAGPDEPDLGIFKFQTGSWSMASDLAYNDVEGELRDYAADSETGKVKATLKLEEVSFVAKNGPRAGQNVTYTKPVLSIKGAA